jgi:aminopeptidase N
MPDSITRHESRNAIGGSIFRLLCIVLTTVALVPAAHANPATTHTLEIRLDPDARTLEGVARIVIHDDAPLDLLLSVDFEVTALQLDGGASVQAPRRDGRLWRWRISAGHAGRSVRLTWNGTLAATPRAMAHRETVTWREPTADPLGSFLPAASFWYPVPVRDGVRLLHAHRVTIDLPVPQRGLVAGTLIMEGEQGGRHVAVFDFPHPGEGVDFIAGPYRIEERTMPSVDGRSIVLRTWFHDGLDHLARAYLESVIGYIDRYERAIGPYPFDIFSVVSSPTPTGFGMPTLTYLGIDVLRLPFIRHTSLGHEVLHNWWGNGVYPDAAGGNWSEGLTTFMADYAYAADEGPHRAREMRLGWLRDLSAIDDGTDRPLAAFTSRHHGVSQAVGYGKATMLFVMLQDHIGTEAFDRAMRRLWEAYRFRAVGWDDLRRVFETEAGEALERFFEQWLTRRGLPEVHLVDAQHDGKSLRITLTQTGAPYQLRVPLRIDTSSGARTVIAELAAGRHTIEMRLDARPLRVVLDPDSRVLRRLARDEAPPILRELQFSADTALLILGDHGIQNAARTLASRLLEHRPRPYSPGTAPGARPLLVVGAAREIMGWLDRHALPAVPGEVSGRGDARVWTFRLASGAPIAVVAADSASALENAIRPLPHYGRQSWLVIDDGRVVERGVWPASAPSIEVRERSHDAGRLGPPGRTR